MPFRVVFKHTTAARDATENVIVRISDDDGNVGHGEGCPRPYVTGETVESARAFLSEHGPVFGVEVRDLADLRRWTLDHRSIIDENPAAFCAIELATIDLFARQRSCSIEELLGLETLAGPFTYSAVLGDSGRFVFGLQVLRYRLGGLRDYKLKLSGDPKRDATKLRWFRGRLGRQVARSVRIDANNFWTDPETAARHLLALDYPYLGIEEPLAADDLAGCAEVADAVGAPIILDESLLRAEQFAALPGSPDRWILNCRISKSGGVLRSLELIEAARKHGLGIIVGAHVGETSLLTRAALTAAMVAGPSLLGQEGAFGTRLLTTDLCDTPIMFGRRGVLGGQELAAIGPTGLGVDVRADRLR